MHWLIQLNAVATAQFMWRCDQCPNLMFFSKFEWVFIWTSADTGELNKKVHKSDSTAINITKWMNVETIFSAYKTTTPYIDSYFIEMN